jgi:hypothetical protein
MTKLLAGGLPDLEGHDQNIRPHPDRLGWLKACPDCAHRTSDPQGIGDRYQRKMMEFDGDAVFYCLHRRTKDGFDRICACYAATHGFAQVCRGEMSFPMAES